MTPQELRDFEEMFATNAWKRVVSDAQEALRERELAALSARTWEQVVFYKGEAAQLGVIISLENAVLLQATHEFESDDE